MNMKLKKLALSAALAGFSLNAAAEAVIGSELEQQLNTMSLTDSTMAVVTYDQLDAVNTEQLQSLLNLGISQGVQFKSLPIVGVVASPAQIEQISQMDGVRSVFANRELEYYNAEARELTGAEKLQTTEFRQRNGMTFTGNGVTVMVNDSGIDATHADLEYGTKVVENVQALTHAQALSVTGFSGAWIEGQLNTDLNVGHGTHCAGTVAGWGTNSDGKYKGAAPGAELVGYGSGAGLSILDALGGYDYALTHLFEFNSPIRVMSNSWGSSGKYEPNGPISVASYKAYKLGLISVFAAGNSGPGEDTHNPYAQIPWGLSVGAGTKQGTLIDFSSRGKRDETGDFTMPDGTQWTYSNEVSIVAPGVDIISTRATTNLTSNGGDADLEAIETEYVPYYTMISGTSMATPHVAGIIAMMLEANPNLTPLETKRILQETATNMPGYEKWEVGAGYVNAYAAVAAALGYNPEHKATVNNLNTFNGNAIVIADDNPEPFEVLYAPAGEPDVYEFEVGPDDVWISASAESLANTVKLRLEAPDGTEYFGNLTLPVLTTSMRVSAPAQVGTWKLSAYGLTSLSGVEADPTGTTNGPGLPESISGEISIFKSGGYEGLDDIGGHPAEAAIQYATSERLVDSFNDKFFRPDRALKRKELAQYLVMGAAVRQHRDLLNEPVVSFSDVGIEAAAFAESAAAPGGALKDRVQEQQPVMMTEGDKFNPNANVSRAELAYSLVQSLGLESEAQAFSGDITVDYQGQSIVVRDQDSIPEELKGYVQLALDLSIVGVRYEIEQGPFDLEPTLVAYFEPESSVTRAEYAVLIGRTYDAYYQ
ncbi:S8 family peptidase [Kangiella sediminilitoris]|uniref:Peptidase S8 n=1 Tax=Kangiella sediminilitoris TaxID=1144748 RepID=A0A1B3BAJ3_9GAMM|nr:S8 family serine peptidase [Kangiella sediminilitoris]AOE49819.1 peptidase S8 [Kangiella sediminilitoris]